jgi:hypothetical protein
MLQNKAQVCNYNCDNEETSPKNCLPSHPAYHFQTNKPLTQKTCLDCLRRCIPLYVRHTMWSNAQCDCIFEYYNVCSFVCTTMGPWSPRHINNAHQHKPPPDVAAKGTKAQGLAVCKTCSRHGTHNKGPFGTLWGGVHGLLSTKTMAGKLLQFNYSWPVSWTV